MKSKGKKEIRKWLKTEINTTIPQPEGLNIHNPQYGEAIGGKQQTPSLHDLKGRTKAGYGVSGQVNRVRP